MEYAKKVERDFKTIKVAYKFNKGEDPNLKLEITKQWFYNMAKRIIKFNYLIERKVIPEKWNKKGVK